MLLLMFKQVNWSLVGITVGVFAGIALFFGVAIIIISKLMAIKSDERVELIKSKLGGANCGACGFAGCEEFAKALCEGKASVDKCGPAGVKNRTEINNILGVDSKGMGPTRIVVSCQGGIHCKDKFEYQGYGDCASQQLLAEGRKECSTGCLGSGTCVNVCPADAIDIREGVAHVIDRLCITCGTCVKECPKGIINRVPASARVHVACSSHCSGKEVSDFCSTGCIACGLCVKKCPHGAIHMDNKLAVIDYQKCTACGACVKVCPKKVIQTLEEI
jgi:electron transport complex protein RnfB